jgi:hypothetical protein
LRAARSETSWREVKPPSFANVDLDLDVDLDLVLDLDLDVLA